MNRIYFIGAGPGDPELLTLKGARRLEKSSLVFAPTPYEETFAELLVGKEVLVPFEFGFDELRRRIEEELERGSVAFLIPGDLAIYSPFQALIDAFGERAEVVPGVGVANAASAFLKKTLDLPGVCNRAISVSPRTLGDGDNGPALKQLAAPGVTLIIYMNNIPLEKLAGQLREGYGGNVPIALLHRLCLPGEEVVTGSLDDIVAKVGHRDYFNLAEPTGRPALTLVIVGETLEAVVDGTWWDYRRENIWKKRSRGG